MLCQLFLQWETLSSGAHVEDVTHGSCPAPILGTVGLLQGLPPGGLRVWDTQKGMRQSTVHLGKAVSRWLPRFTAQVCHTDTLAVGG